MVRALLLERHERLPVNWRQSLTAESIEMTVASTLAAGLERLKTSDIQIILLNGVWPDTEAVQFCQQLRQNHDSQFRTHHDIPIVVISAAEAYPESIELLSAGADDVWLQSMSLAEFRVRLQAVLRRLSVQRSEQLQLGNLTLEPRSRQAWVGNALLDLTPEEYNLLEVLVSAPDHVFSEVILLRMLWPQNPMPSPQQLSQLVSDLNYKLTLAGLPDSLELLYGLGWCWRSQPQAHRSLPATVAADAVLAPHRQAIWQRYRSEYWQRLDSIAMILADWNQIQPLERNEAHHHAQTLAGALGSFGLTKASQGARILAAGLHALERETAPTPEQVTSLIQQVQQLRFALGDPNRQPLTPETVPIATVCTEASQPLRNRIQIWSPDRAWAENLATEADLRGLSVTIRSDLAIAADALDPDQVDLLIIDADQLNHPALVDLTQLQPPPPFLLLLSEGTLPTRIQATRLGAQHLLIKPVGAEVILEQVFNCLERPMSASTLLIADDDPALLNYLQQLLQPLGWRVMVCSYATRFWEILEASRPDLIVLDVALPGCNGFELCRVLRSDRHWSTQPILLLAERDDPDWVRQAFQCGADDLLTKPLVGAELAARLYHRLDTYRQAQRLAATDSLTGLVNQRRAREMLLLLLGLAQRHRQPLTFVALQIDPSAIAIDRPSEPMQQLMLLATLLQKFCRREDVVARWTQDQFVIGFYGVRWSIVVERLSQLRSLIQSSSSCSNAAPWQISAGIAEFPIHGMDLPSLIAAATALLQQAQQEGGDRILVTETVTPLIRSA